MSIAVREPGTYRTHSGILVHTRALADGSIRIEREDGLAHARIGEEVVKLSDDPDWPDVDSTIADPQLFAD